MIFIVGNGLGYPSSNPGQVCLLFAKRQYLYEKYASNYSPSINE